ncbi:MAG: hypothetical protein SGARI_003112 [Bacillariaceae sp.]
MRNANEVLKEQEELAQYICLPLDKTEMHYLRQQHRDLILKLYLVLSDVAKWWKVMYCRRFDDPFGWACLDDPRAVRKLVQVLNPETWKEDCSHLSEREQEWAKEFAIDTRRRVMERAEDFPKYVKMVKEHGMEIAETFGPDGQDWQKELKEKLEWNKLRDIYVTKMLRIAEEAKARGNS